MKRISALVLICFSILLFAKAHAQDVFDTTNTATRSYNYAEIQYLPAMDVDLPFMATLVVDINDSWSFHGRYVRQDDDAAGVVDGSNVKLKLTLEDIALGFLYHQPFSYMADSDWVAGLSFGRSTLDLEGTVQDETGTESGKFSDSANFQEAYLGLRRTLNPQLEGEVGINLLRDEEGDFTFSGDIKLVYRIIPSVDIAVGMRKIGQSDLFGVGFRYTW